MFGTSKLPEDHSGHSLGPIVTNSSILITIDYSIVKDNKNSRTRDVPSMTVQYAITKDVV